tara:strand:- start:1705 stop:1947 length:243 start_codon:yes stop_codon:yes gene_type:complete
MKDKKLSLTQEQFNTLKEIFVERVVDNMSTKDLVNYVMDDLADLYKNMSDVEFLDEAKNWLADDFTDTIQDVFEIHPNKE